MTTSSDSQDTARREVITIFPRCFDSLAQYELWRRSKNLSKKEQCSHCADCLPSYQLRMKKLGRCENPKQMFTFDEEGGVVGCGA